MNNDENIKGIIQNALRAFEVPEECLVVSMAFIEGLKIGGASSTKQPDNEKSACNDPTELFGEVKSQRIIPPFNRYFRTD